MDKLDRLLSVEDLATYLGIPLATIYAWRYRGHGPPGFRVGRHLRFRERDVEEWIANQLRYSDSDRGGRADPRRLSS